MIIGENAKDTDLDVNAVREEEVDQYARFDRGRSYSTGPFKPLNLEQAIEFITDDEFVEVVSKSLRLRKGSASEQAEEEFIRDGRRVVERVHQIEEPKKEPALSHVPRPLQLRITFAVAQNSTTRGLPGAVIWSAPVAASATIRRTVCSRWDSIPKVIGKWMSASEPGSVMPTLSTLALDKFSNCY